MRPPMDPDAPLIFEAHLYALVAPIQGCVKRQSQTRNRGDINQVLGADGKLSKPLFSRSQVRGQQLALGPVVLERKG